MSRLRGSNANACGEPAPGGRAASGGDCAFATGLCARSASRRRGSGATATTPAEADERADRDRGDEEGGRDVLAPTSACALPRLLDQSLDERLKLIVCNGIAGARRTRRCGNAHACAVIARTKELVDFARLHGYRRDELVKIIQDLG